MPATITTAELKAMLDQQQSFAFIDVREHGEYNAAHIAGASSVPRRQLEYRMARLVPHLGATVVVCDDTGARALLAARTLERIGYRDLRVLGGGVNRWAADGLPTEWGINVPSKDFGEMVEVRYLVPTIEADELERRRLAGEPLLILDTRTPEEYQRFCIPDGRSVPGGELALRVTDIARTRPEATIVVNCAGRTRSIIGARVLQRMGLSNIVSLKNGTSGWVLAGLELEQGAARLDLPEPSPEGRATAQTFARRVASEDGVGALTVAALDDIMASAAGRPVYLIDVRTEREFSEGHIPGFWWFPGGQAVQRCDDVVAVRDATIVFCSGDSIRSFITASWYRQLGFANVHALDGGVSAWQAAGRPVEQGMAEQAPFGLAEAAAVIAVLDAAALDAERQGGAGPVVLFLDPSNEFARGHVPGGHWAPRGSLELQIRQVAPDHATPLVTTDSDGRGALLGALTLKDLGYTNVRALAGGMTAWRAAGLAEERGLTGVMRPPDDILPAGPERSPANMIEYLRWEEALGRKYETAER